MERMYSSSREPSPGSLISSIADTIAPSDTGTWCHTIHKLQAVRYKSHIIHDMIERMCSSSKEHETSYNWPIPGSLISSIADESALLDTCTWYRTTALHINYKRYDANRILHTTWWEFTQAQKSERLHITNLQIQLNYRRYNINRILHMVRWSICTQECNTSFILPIPGSLISSIADEIAPSDIGTWYRTTHKLYYGIRIITYWLMLTYLYDLC